MNLSAFKNTSANSLTGAASDISANVAEVERSKSVSVSGADFANFLHNQVQAVRNNMRPNLAASDKALPHADAKGHEPASQHTQTPENSKSNKNNIGPHDELRSSGRKQSDRKDSKSLDKHSQSNEIRASEAEEAQSAADLAAEKELSAMAHTDDAIKQNADQAAALTTIAVSDKLQIITAANTTASDQSVADFALAMGLDTNQVKSLFGESAANAATAKLTNNNISTQQMLGINSLPHLLPADPLAGFAANGPMTLAATGSSKTNILNMENTPISTADFQELKTQSPAPDQGTKDLLGKMENMQFQIGSNTAALQTQNIQQPISTLAVLSMMDAHLRTEDIEALKTEFDSSNSIETAKPVNDNLQPAPQPNMPTRAAAANSQTQSTPAFVNNPDMAQTYDKLSQKLTTELAARMHEKLNAGEWKMKFALKPASLGLVDVQLEMKDGKLSAHFQSDTNLTQDLLQNGSQRLKDALADLGMNNASVFVAQGDTQRQSGQNSSQLSGGRSQPDDNREKLSEESGLKIAEDSLPRRSSSSQFDSYA